MSIFFFAAISLFIFLLLILVDHRSQIENKSSTSLERSYVFILLLFLHFLKRLVFCLHCKDDCFYNNHMSHCIDKSYQSVEIFCKVVF